MKRTSLKRLTLVLAVAVIAVGLAVAVVLVVEGLHRAAKAADVVAIDETLAKRDYPAALIVQAQLLEVDLDREIVTSTRADVARLTDARLDTTHHLDVGVTIVGVIGMAIGGVADDRPWRRVSQDHKKP